MRIVIPALSLVETFVIPDELQSTPQAQYQIGQPLRPSTDPNKSYLGLPVFAPLTFKDGSYLNPDGTRQTYRGFTLQAVLLNVSQSKNVVKTAVAGRNGTVKEYVSDGDYIINIQGVIANSIAEYPEQDVTRLIDILKVPAAIDVVCPVLQLHGIYSIVVESYTLPSTEGKVNVQRFEIEAVSDTPVELV